MIRGLGMDVVEIDRFARAMERNGERFLRRLFTGAEIEYCRSMPNPPAHFAARFAAKEAFSKALGTGMSAGLQWVDAEILRDANGRPSLRLSDEAQAACQAIGATRNHLSITHSLGVAAAVVVLEGDA